jgi:large subunit ribosomal protein L10
VLTRQQKEETVAILRDKLVKANVIVAVDYRGLTVAQASDLRSRLRSVADGQIEYRVAKNTLLKRAIAGTEMEGLHAYLTGPTAVALAPDEPSAMAKILVDFAKENDKFQIKGGVVEGDVVDLDTINQLAALPSMEQLRGMLAGTIQSPLRNLAGALSGLLGNLRNALEQRQGQLEG